MKGKCTGPKFERNHAVMLRSAGLALLLSAAGLVDGTQAQFTPDDIEAAGPAGTYLDLVDGTTSRNGIDMTWSNFSALAWDFPDGSDGSEFVNGNAADDKEADGDTPEIQLDFSGLQASSQYDLFLLARYRPEGNDEGGDISWGTTSGSLTLVQFDEVNLPAGSFTINSDTDGDGLAALKVGSVTSDGAGALTLYVDNGLDWHDDVDEDPLTIPIGRDRTQFDGVYLTIVPEPSTALLGLAVLLPICGVRRRRIGA